MYKACLFLVTLLLLSACSYDETPRTVTVKDEFTMELPAYLEELPGLNPEARLQYGNKFRNYYVLVLDKSADNQSFEQIVQEAHTELIGLLKNPTQTDSLNMQINGLTTRRIRVDGIVGGNEGVSERILYDLFFVKGPKDKVYQMTIWTWYKWKEKYDQVTDRIANSFKEIN